MFPKALLCLSALTASLGVLPVLRGEDLDLERQVKLDFTCLPKEQAEPLSYASVVEKCLPSAVTVLVTKEGKNSEALPVSPLDLGGDDKRRQEPARDSGSGVILTSNGYLLTNNHVIEDAISIKVRAPE